MTKTIFLIITAILVILGAFYFLQSQEKEEAIEKIIDEIAVEENMQQEQDEIRGDEWDTFVNIEYSYTTQYPQNWEVEAEDYDRVWFYSSEEEITILFASSIATQTGFPEYEMISMSETTVDTQEATVSLLYSEDTRAIISVFESENYPHFTMMTYQYETDAQDEKMLEFNEEFLNKITFQ